MLAGLALMLAIVAAAAWAGAEIWRAVTNSARVLDEPPGYLSRER